MKKIATNIADQQDARLKALAKYMGLTQAELFRRFLEDGLMRAEREARDISPDKADNPYRRNDP
jgi:hypothetical protein